VVFYPKKELNNNITQKVIAKYRQQLYSQYVPIKLLIANKGGVPCFGRGIYIFNLSLFFHTSNFITRESKIVYDLLEIVEGVKPPQFKFLTYFASVKRINIGTGFSLFALQRPK